MVTRFNNVYSKEALDEICDLLDQAYDNFPFSIVSSLDRYEQHLEAGDYLRAFKSAIDFFEISVQYTSGLMISLLNQRQVAFDDDMRAILEKVVDKPLSFGDWVSDIFLALIRKSYEFMPDHPLIISLYEGLCKDRSGNILTGWTRKGAEFKSIVAFRNDVAHDTSLSNELYKEIILVIEPRLWRMLAMLEPLASLHFFVLEQAINTDSEFKSYTILTDRGLSDGKSLRVSSDLTLDEHAYYLSDKEIRRKGIIEGSSIVKLSPFIIYHYNDEVAQDQKFPYVFQTVVAKNLRRMVFISANEKARRKETELFKDTFLILLERIFGRLMQNDKHRISIRKEKLLTEYQELATIQTNRFISQQIHSDKYDPSIFLDRVYLSENYERFSQSSCIALVILGDAGAGKTNQICHWASQANTSFIPVAFNSKNFTQLTLEEQIKETFNPDARSAYVILEALEAVLEKANATACFFFDAINECAVYKDAKQGSGPIDLLMAIHKLFVEKSFPHIKVVISCRSYTWEELLNKDALLEFAGLYYTVSNQASENVVLKGFSEEEFASVYPKYLHKYGLSTSPDAILEDRYALVRRRLYDPLILKTAAQNFRGRDLPADLRQFNSTRLFQQRLDILEKEPGGRVQLSILEGFTALLWTGFTDAVPLRYLFQAYEDTTDPAHRFALKIFRDENFRYSEAFTGLLDAGILRVEKTAKKEVRFVYERFNEFLFARHFLLNAPAAYDKVPIASPAYEDVLKMSGHSTIVIAALRNALIMDFYQKQHDPAAIVQLALSQLYESQPLVEETLSVLVDESYQDVLSILEHMLDFEKEVSRQLIRQRTELEEVLEKDKKRLRLSQEATGLLQDQVAAINERLLRIVKVRKIAISVIYKIFKSDRINVLLAAESTDPKRLLWIAMADPLPEVRDNASIYIYYISRYDTELGMLIITALSEKVKKTPVINLFSPSVRKELQQSYIEPAARVGLFLVIDGLIERKDYKLAMAILETWKQIVRKFTLNHVLIKMVMPFFKFLFSRQTVVQTEYVNNGIEYRHFWDTIPIRSTAGGWSQETYKMLVPYLRAETPGYAQHETIIIDGYLTGDSFSFFLLERIMIVQGVADWDNISSIVQRLAHLPEGERFKPYIEMSLLYSLFQIYHKSAHVNPQLEQISSSLARRWSLEHKGFFYAHYNDRANGGKPYKQYVLYWYASAYCQQYGDGSAKPGSDSNVPLFRDLILLAYRQKDKALLYNCLENMAILVSAAGYYKTALQLFEFLISLFRNESEIIEFDRITLKGALYEKGLRSFMCDMLGTVKSYYPKEVDHFIVNKLKASQFPDLDAFREEIFNHSLSHEGIGDLLTHKFGNFVIWGILKDEHIRKFFIDICDFAYVSKNYPEWFDNCIRHIFQEVFDVKN